MQPQRLGMPRQTRFSQWTVPRNGSRPTLSQSVVPAAIAAPATIVYTKRPDYNHKDKTFALAWRRAAGAGNKECALAEGFLRAKAESSYSQRADALSAEYGRDQNSDKPVVGATLGSEFLDPCLSLARLGWETASERRCRTLWLGKRRCPGSTVARTAAAHRRRPGPTPRRLELPLGRWTVSPSWPFLDATRAATQEIDPQQPSAAGIGQSRRPGAVPRNMTGSSAGMQYSPSDAARRRQRRRAATQDRSSADGLWQLGLDENIR